jgi:conjugal transfer/type IV secretion protein DotA/TraY
MLRLCLLIILSVFSTLVLAADAPPSLFEPAKKDVSIYYLGAMFGNQLIPTGTDMHLISYIFEIFNQVALAVGLIIVIYTAIVGVMETAGQGKVLGEKWSATWLPVRIVLGMALLVPKAGTGYSMGQFMVIWLIIQGVAAADSIWSKALDYFIEGGGIYADTTSYSSSYMTEDNLRRTYLLETALLDNATCVAAHNASDNAKLYGKYDVYQTDDYYHVNFGSQKAWDETSSESGGQECGFIYMPSFSKPDPNNGDLVIQTYSNAFYNMARGLEKETAEFLAGPDGGIPDEWSTQFGYVQQQAVTFIEYLKGASNILNPVQPHPDEKRQDLQELKDYGWILAGNYYMTLSSFGDDLQGITVNIPDTSVEPPLREVEDKYQDAIQNAKDFWEIDASIDDRFTKTFMAWPEKYVVPGYPNLDPGTPEEGEQYRLTRQKLEELEKYVKQLGSMNGATSDTQNPIYYMEQITGFGNETREDPILHAARYGKLLTEISVAMIGIAVITYFVMMVAAAAIGGIACTTIPAIWVGVFVFIILTAPLIFGIAAFLYTQGVMLGVALPLIPFMIYLVGVIGWFLAVIESMVAMPLVAIGLIFPETNQDIWGKAEPAYMMILNLMLRPSLMVIGFVFALILTWIAIDLLNAAFYMFIKDAVQIENYLFGYIVVTTVYAGLLLTIVAKTFELINILPNKTLAWIGDRTQAQPGSEEMVSSVKGGTEKGGGAVGGAITAGGSTISEGSKMGMQAAQSAQKKQEKDARAAIIAMM